MKVLNENFAVYFSISRLFNWTPSWWAKCSKVVTLTKLLLLCMWFCRRKSKLGPGMLYTKGYYCVFCSSSLTLIFLKKDMEDRSYCVLPEVSALAFAVVAFGGLRETKTSVCLFFPPRLCGSLRHSWIKWKQVRENGWFFTQQEIGQFPFCCGRSWARA